MNGGNIYINDCYNIGDITNADTQGYSGKTGGIWGYLQKNINTITNCYQLQDCIKQGIDTDQTEVETKTEDEIKALNLENYVVVEGENDGYPILAWENK